VIVIPEGFSDQLNRQVRGEDVKTDAAALRIYYSQGNTSSEMAAEIIEQILAGVDREILIRMGLFQESAAIPSEQVWVGEKASEISYINFLLPGIILMGYFINGLFGIPGSILFSRDQHVLRRYWVTPLNVPRFLSGLSIGHLALCLIQSMILLLLGRYALGATISFTGFTTVLYLLLSAITFMAFGFLIASLARTANAGMAIANILNMPMMFLSGLFFPTGGFPAAIMVIVYVNPLSYLAAGIRTSVGVESGVFSVPLIIGVPLAWIALSIAVAARKLRWDVGR
jgi:ABC-2 type transport system permease protein